MTRGKFTVKAQDKTTCLTTGLSFAVRHAHVASTHTHPMHMDIPGAAKKTSANKGIHGGCGVSRPKSAAADSAASSSCSVQRLPNPLRGALYGIRARTVTSSNMKDIPSIERRRLLSSSSNATYSQDQLWSVAMEAFKVNKEQVIRTNKWFLQHHSEILSAALEGAQVGYFSSSRAIATLKKMVNDMAAEGALQKEGEHVTESTALVAAKNGEGQCHPRMCGFFCRGMGREKICFQKAGCLVGPACEAGSSSSSGDYDSFTVGDNDSQQPLYLLNPDHRPYSLPSPPTMSSTATTQPGPTPTRKWGCGMADVLWCAPLRSMLRTAASLGVFISFFFLFGAFCSFLFHFFFLQEEGSE